ncbi:hypothetical protein BpHYR1_048839 [Brachionus plicatilis]|uniref:Uncharacterized protein n=1 Tax=Brachionus plicatilis TaxID=10195 RepID=A0A3M7S5X6_BRAPC|nr:hypothetical protein BpHYR1_048839 [Brachionus plicatilis]
MHDNFSLFIKNCTGMLLRANLDTAPGTALQILPHSFRELLLHRHLTVSPSGSVVKILSVFSHPALIITCRRRIYFPGVSALNQIHPES